MAPLRLVEIGEADERPKIESPYSDWGEIDPAAMAGPFRRWLIEAAGLIAGDMSAHPIWYGPSPGSKAMNIGIGVLPELRGRGLGSAAQRLLAETLHAEGIVRVEASTDVRNVPEQRALARAGFQLEGVLRGAQVRSDGRHDLQLWSHLARP